MRGHPGIDRRPQLVRVRDRSQRLAARGLDSRRSRRTAPRSEVHKPLLPAGLEIRLADWQHVILIELCGDLTGENCNRLSRCLEHALETPAERVILDLRGLDRLNHAAVSPILVAHLTAESEHRRLLLIPGTAGVQRVLDQVQGPFDYLGPGDGSSLRYEVGRPGVFTDVVHARARRRRRILGFLLGSTDRLIAATEHAPEPICTLEYVGARALLRAVELWLWIEGQPDRA
jgi:hypothetical protein